MGGLACFFFAGKMSMRRAGSSLTIYSDLAILNILLLPPLANAASVPPSSLEAPFSVRSLLHASLGSAVLPRPPKDTHWGGRATGRPSLSSGSHCFPEQKARWVERFKQVARHRCGLSVQKTGEDFPRECGPYGAARAQTEQRIKPGFSGDVQGAAGEGACFTQTSERADDGH